MKTKTEIEVYSAEITKNNYIKMRSKIQVYKQTDADLGVTEVTSCTIFIINCAMRTMEGGKNT